MPARTSGIEHSGGYDLAQPWCRCRVDLHSFRQRQQEGVLNRYIVTAAVTLIIIEA
jgi:hypothetical protein